MNLQSGKFESVNWAGFAQTLFHGLLICITWQAI